MSKFLSLKANNILPYIAGEQPKDREYIKLNTNENPFQPSLTALDVLKFYDTKKLKLYPDPTCEKLRQAIAEKEGVEKENIFVGNGSDDVLALSFLAFFNPNDKYISFADITYSFYPVYAELFNIKTKLIALNENFCINKEDYLNFDEKCQGLIICNPNAPTSIALKKETIKEIVKKNFERIVILDEAYVDFCDESVSSEIKKFKNLLVVKTFSKSYSLAGIRCGYAIGDKELIDGLNRIKDSFNSYPIDSICQSVCERAVLDYGYHEACVLKIKDNRNFLAESLRNLDFKVLESSSNFLFVEHKKMSGLDLYLKLKENKILVRHFNKDRINNFLRITIGTIEDMMTLVGVVKNIINGGI